MYTRYEKLSRTLAILRQAADVPVVFEYQGLRTLPGYHVTELKHASITAVDCGRRTGTWEEIVLELLDGRAGSKEVGITCGKLLAILESTLPLDPEARLIVEFGPRHSGVRKLRIDAIDLDGQHVERHDEQHVGRNDERHDVRPIVISLADVNARCKPIGRLPMSWVERATGCCTRRVSNASTQASRCC